MQNQFLFKLFVMRIFSSFLFLGIFALLTFSSCRKAWHVQDQYIGEYEGILSVMEDSVLLVGSEACTVVLEKEGKTSYRIYSPTHENYFPNAVYEVSKEVTKELPKDQEGQGGFRTDDSDWRFSLLLDEQVNEFILVISAENQPLGNEFIYLGAKSR